MDSQPRVVASPPSGAATAPSVLFQLVATKLGGNPLDFIRERRQTGNVRPFRIIAQELSTECGVDVTYEAVRRWWRATPEGQKEVDDETSPLS